MIRRLPPAGTKIDLSKLASCMAKGILSRDEKPLKEAVAANLNKSHVYLISQGRAALTIILKALATDCDKKDVIIPSYTCYTVPAAVVRAGLRVLPVDIDPYTLDFDREQLERIDCSKVLAIVPSNLYGIPNDLPYLEKFAERKGLFLIDDAAQAYGARFGDKAVGTFGRAGFYSLSKGKSFTTLEGGIVVTEDEKIAGKLDGEIKSLRPAPLQDSLSEIISMMAYTVFLNPSLYWIPDRLLNLGRSEFDPSFKISGYNPMFSYLGAYLTKKIDGLNLERRRNASLIREGLAKLDDTRVIWGYKEAFSIYVRLPVLIKDRSLREITYQKLRSEGLGVSVSYPKPVSQIPGIQRHLAVNMPCPGGEEVAERILTLPTHSFVRRRDIEKITSIIGEAR